MEETGETHCFHINALLTIRQTLVKGHIAKTDPGDESQLEPTNEPEASEAELGPDDVQIDITYSDTLEALYNTNRAWLRVRLGDVTATPARDEQYLTNLSRC
jgi:hypothetical protein